jgi:hypothetical protein
VGERPTRRPSTSQPARRRLQPVVRWQAEGTDQPPFASVQKRLNPAHWSNNRSHHPRKHRVSVTIHGSHETIAPFVRDVLTLAVLGRVDCMNMVPNLMIKRVSEQPVADYRERPSPFWSTCQNTVCHDLDPRAIAWRRVVIETEAVSNSHLARTPPHLCTLALACERQAIRQHDSPQASKMSRVHRLEQARCDFMKPAWR